MIEGQNRQRESINFLVTIDRNYLMPWVTMLLSYKEVHQDVRTDVYIARMPSVFRPLYVERR